MKLLLSLVLYFAFGYSLGIGDRLVRTAAIYTTLPITVSDAISQEWLNYSACDGNLGIPYTDSGYGEPTKRYPVTLYYTGAGQIAGLAMDHFGPPLGGLEKFYRPIGNETYRISLSFRAGGDLCSSTKKYSEPLGDQIVINQGTLDLSIPLNETAATSAKWSKGACIPEMGTHWSYDLTSAPVMSWKSANLLPVVTMYNEQAGGGISSVFVTTPNLQSSEPIGVWEFPIPSELMCYNWCSDSCTWDVYFWNTLHFYLDDRSLNTCPASC